MQDRQEYMYGAYSAIASKEDGELDKGTLGFLGFRISFFYDKLEKPNPFGGF